TLRTLAAMGLKPSDGDLLLAGIFGNTSGRKLLEKFAAQGAPVAREVIKLWQSKFHQAQGDNQAIAPRMATENMELHTALTRFLAYPPVEQSPAMRRAVGDLFELPMQWEQPIVSRRTHLGMLERLATWTSRQRLRAELLRALDALESIPLAQRRALCRHLVAQEPVVLALRLLEQGGWGRPPWLRISAPGAAKTSEDRKRQLFMLARRHWHRLLSSDISASRARALAAEMLGTQFWSPRWIERLQEEQITRFYRTLFNALTPRLRAVMGAAWMVATDQKLARLSELVGLVDCLPPRLPAQIDQRAFFEAMQERLNLEQDEQEDASDAREGDDLPPTLRRLRRDLQAARWRTCAWFLALAGLAEENEYRLLLAVMSLAAGNADQVGRWLAGQAPSPAEAAALLLEVKRWNNQTSITEQHIPALLQTAAAQVRPVWEQLRRMPRF
ncbi:MAG TPA: hypothetical protein VFU69_13655, partial [Ktedonobacterales bacterium]|nr:hypothetical protein [Ktedonobacterales bacterium]